MPMVLIVIYTYNMDQTTNSTAKMGGWDIDINGDDNLKRHQQHYG